MIICPQTPPLLPIFHIGFGPDSFIAKAGWHPGYTRTNFFKLEWLAASRDAQKAAQMAQHLRVHGAKSSHEYDRLLERVFENLPMNKDAVICVTTETGNHTDNLIAAVNAGAKFLVVDKPGVRTVAEYNRLAEVIQQSNALLRVTYNHLMNAPVFMIQRLVAEHGAHSVESFFYQQWLRQKGDFRQFVWRTSDRFCGPLDIGSHAENMASFVLGRPLTSVSKVVLGSSNFGKKDVFTSGSCRGNFSGVQGKISFDQTREGHQDDIGVMVRLKDDRTVMWRLELGENLWVSKVGRPDPFNPAHWTRHTRGDVLFSPEICAIFDLTPPGHSQGWGSMWEYFFLALAGKIYRVLGIDLGFEPGKAHPILSVELPGISAIRQTAQYVAALGQAHDGGDATVELAKADHDLEYPS